MTQENVDLARRAYEALNRGDHAAFLAATDPDVELVLPEGGMTAETVRGLTAVREFLEGYRESFEDLRMEPEKFFERGDLVLAFLRMSGTGRGSGIEIAVRPAHLMTIREGKVQRLEAFTERNRQAALDALAGG